MVLEVGDVRPEQQMEVICAVEVSRVLTKGRLCHDDESFACNSREIPQRRPFVSVVLTLLWQTTALANTSPIFCALGPGAQTI
jgi:hypothetical protein